MPVDATNVARPMGTVLHFDRMTGKGSIRDDASGADYPFDASQLRWDKPGSPNPRKQYSFTIVVGPDGKAMATKLEIA